MFKIERTENVIKVTSPYRGGFVVDARNMGGKWNADEKVWEIPKESEKALKNAMWRNYKYDIDKEEQDWITIEYKAYDFQDSEGFRVKIGSKTTVERIYRDSYPKLYDTMIVDGDDFRCTGGSAKYPRVNANDTTVLQTTLLKGYYDELTDEEKAKITIIQEKSEKEKLESRKAELLKELEEIEKQLAEL